MIKMKQSGIDALAMLALIEESPRTAVQLKEIMSMEHQRYKNAVGRIRHLLDTSHTPGSGNELIFSRNAAPFYLSVSRLPILGEKLEKKSDLNARRLVDYVAENEGVLYGDALMALGLTHTQMADAKSNSMSQIKTVRGQGRQVLLYIKTSVVPMPWRKPRAADNPLHIVKKRIYGPTDANYDKYVSRMEVAKNTLFKSNWIPIADYGSVAA
jgi:hypothetical protein